MTEVIRKKFKDEELEQREPGEASTIVRMLHTMEPGDAIDVTNVAATIRTCIPYINHYNSHTDVRYGFRKDGESVYVVRKS